MVNSSIIDAQKLINDKVYPPTHHYDVATLTPEWPLSERLEIILKLCPEFFTAKVFLDVGCSKGFFSLYAAKTSDAVFAIDPDNDALDTWRDIRPENVYLQNCSFKEATGTADRIWIGNGHHYLWRDDPNYITQLIDMATDLVLIEGPIGPHCPDMKGFEDFPNEREFLSGMKKGFKFLDCAQSVSYTPGRAMWLFKTN